MRQLKVATDDKGAAKPPDMRGMAEIKKSRTRDNDPCLNAPLASDSDIPIPKVLALGNYELVKRKSQRLAIKADPSQGNRTIIPTEKQRTFMREMIASGGKQTDSAMRAFNCKNRAVAKTMGCETMRNPAVRNYLQKYFMDMDVTPHKAILAIGQGLVARKDDVDDHRAKLQAAKMILDTFEPKEIEQKEIMHRVTISSEPPEVIRFVALLGRYPTDAERQNLLAPPVDVSVENNNNEE